MLKKKNPIPNISVTSNGKTIILSNCFIGDGKKLKFIKKQEKNGSLSSIGINKRIRFLLCIIDIFSKCAWVVPLKDKKD